LIGTALVGEDCASDVLEAACHRRPPVEIGQQLGAIRQPQALLARPTLDRRTISGRIERRVHSSILACLSRDTVLLKPQECNMSRQCERTINIFMVLQCGSG
jgi:hypothetical protein